MLGALDMGLVLGEALPHWGDNVKLQELWAGPNRWCQELSLRTWPRKASAGT